MYRTNLGTSADLILYNARAITLDQERPNAELVAIEGNKVLGIGDNDSLELFKGAGTKLIDCEGRAIVPGFNDAHCHPLSFAATLLYVDCSPSAVKNIVELQARIREQAERIPEGKWIRAANYDEFYLAEKRPPNRWEMDEASPQHPVILTHRSGHDCVLNSLALRLAGITRETPDLQGGTIHREPQTGEPNGLISGRNERVEIAIPPLDEEELEQGMRLANQEYLSAGITSLQDTTWTNGLRHWQMFQRLIGGGKLSPRLRMLIGIEALEEFQSVGLSMGSGDSRLRLGGVKLALDESTGCPHPPQEDINYHALRAHKAGFQIAFHVSDVYTLQASLAAIEFTQQQIPKTDHRHRLEHCAVCPPELLGRLGASRAMVICQPSFLYHSGQRYLVEVPSAKLSWLYPIGSFLNGGVKVVASSDSPMVPCNPLVGIYAAVTRKVETGRTLSPRESISPLEALKMYTLWGAYASFEEGVKGSISPGKLADLVVLSNDPTQAAPEEIKDIRVMLTIIDGKVGWER
ncbi:MAG: amidohydrolase [Dehalococcoidia bacterium]|nr:amidohydrolase [Dehalococcoidia bacterium]